MNAAPPATAAEAAAIVGQAFADSEPLEIVGGGSKRGLGRPPAPARRLDLSRLAGIIEYEPSELRLTARAATPLAEVVAMLESSGQMLAFEPPDWRALLGGEGAATLGGVLACNLAGARRVRAGAARDHFLGFAAINGRGEIWKAGGTVVKNVTGYDMCKLQCGAFGTLSVLTEVTLKVVPKPETAATLLLAGLTDAAAIQCLSKALNSPFEVSAAAHLPAGPAARAGVAAGGALTALRLEGPAPSVAFRLEALRQLLGHGPLLAAAPTAAFWANIGAVAPLLQTDERCVWRLCPTPAAAAALFADIAAQFASAEPLYDWGGGLLWVGLNEAEAGPECGAATIRAALAKVGGHATLIRAPEPARRRTEVFAPLPPALAALTSRIKSKFDPRGILNPGRLWEGR